MIREYFYSKEKDEELEKLSEQINAIPTFEGKVEFFKTISKETYYELLSFLRWETAKEQYKKELLEESKKELLKRNKELREEQEEIKFQIAASILAEDSLNLQKKPTKRDSSHLNEEYPYGEDDIISGKKGYIR